MISVKFTSKKDWWLALIVWGIVAIACGQLWNHFDWLMLIGNVALISLISAFWFGTYYVIDENRLVVSLGITRKKIPIEQITAIRVARSVISSAALSIDRLEITYRETPQFPNVVYVSPKEQQRFVKQLYAQNPRIELDEKLRGMVEGQK